ncbi:MAG: hypothetical protein E7812_15570 [Phenylobacterium sp.]|nr:MAG: hypothetical protein E7812_15570 [Phenylobacterium sp.]
MGQPAAAGEIAEDHRLAGPPGDTRLGRIGREHVGVAGGGGPGGVAGRGRAGHRVGDGGRRPERSDRQDRALRCRLEASHRQAPSGGRAPDCPTKL